VAIYREKARLARDVAVNGMEEQRQKMYEQLEQIRNDTAAELDKLTEEYETKLTELNTKSGEELVKLETS
jgi:hypothetical protein